MAYDIEIQYFDGEAYNVIYPKIKLTNNDGTVLSAAYGGTGYTTLTDSFTRLSAACYGTCSTAADVTEKAVTLSNFTTSDLVSGARILVRFTYANTATAPTLNVNSTGAKNIAKQSTTSVAAGSWVAGELVEFVYYSSRWHQMTGMAQKMKTARTILTNLASTSTASFDGTANILPGVTGTLAVGNGGTGVTSYSSLGTKLASYVSKSEVTSYTPTSTCGSSNPTSVTFTITPKFALIVNKSNFTFGLFVKGASYLQGFVPDANLSNIVSALATIKTLTTTLAWYASTPEKQLNAWLATNYVLGIS